VISIGRWAKKRAGVKESPRPAITSSPGEDLPAVDAAAIVVAPPPTLALDEPALPADRHPAAVYLAGLTEGSRRPTRQALDVIARFAGATIETLPWHRLGFQHVAAIRAHLASTLAPATANRALSALRQVLHTAFRLGLMSEEARARAVDVEPVRGTRLGKGRNVDPGELRKLFDACDATPGGARDRALLALLYVGGLRRHEVAALTLADVEDGPTLRVLGKGNKERRVPVTSAGPALATWMRHRGDAPGPLLYALSPEGRTVPRAVSPQTVRDRLAFLARKAGVSAFSPHDMRRTFVGDLLDAGADLATVQAMAGHSSPTTTAKYDRRGERAKERAATLLVVPRAPDDV
jgi:site-specific recombinase XerD